MTLSTSFVLTAARPQSLAFYLHTAIILMKLQQGRGQWHYVQKITNTEQNQVSTTALTCVTEREGKEKQLLPQLLL